MRLYRATAVSALDCLAVVGFPLPAQSAPVGKKLDVTIALRRVGAWSRQTRHYGVVAKGSQFRLMIQIQ